MNVINMYLLMVVKWLSESHTAT